MRNASSDGAGTLRPAPKNVKKKVAGLKGRKKPSSPKATRQLRTAKKNAAESAASDSKAAARKASLHAETAAPKKGSKRPFTAAPQIKKKAAKLPASQGPSTPRRTRKTAARDPESLLVLLEFEGEFKYQLQAMAASDGKSVDNWIMDSVRANVGSYLEFESSQGAYGDMIPSVPGYTRTTPPASSTGATAAQENPSRSAPTQPPPSVDSSVGTYTQHPDLQKLFAGEKNAEWFVIQSFGPAADALRLPGDGLVLWTGAGWRFMTVDRCNLPLTQDQASRRMLRYHLPAPVYRNLYPEESGQNDAYARVDTVDSEPEPPPLKLPTTGRITVSLTVESSDLVRWYCGVSHHRLEATVEGIVFRALESAKASYEDESGDDSFNIVLEDVLSAAQRGTDERAELLSDGRATFVQLDPLTERWLARHEFYRQRSRHNAVNAAIIEKLENLYETPLGDRRVPEGFPDREDWKRFTAACDAAWERRREAFGSRLALA